jgi:hypothetical protein
MTTTARETYSMLGSEPIWHAASACHEALAEAGTPHAVIGGVAVCLHGYRRNTVDIDLLVRTEDMPAIRAALTKAGFSWDDKVREFRDPVGVPVQFVAAGERAGKGSEVLLPSPADDHVAVMIVRTTVAACSTRSRSSPRRRSRSRPISAPTQSDASTASTAADPATSR